MRRKFGPYIVSVGKSGSGYAYKIQHETVMYRNGIPLLTIAEKVDCREDDYPFDNKHDAMISAKSQIKRLCEETKAALENGGDDYDVDLSDM
jgi:hypothetical protein